MFKQTKLGSILQSLLFSKDIILEQEKIREKLGKLTRQDIEKYNLAPELTQELFNYKLQVLMNTDDILDAFCPIYDKWEDTLLEILQQ